MDFSKVPLTSSVPTNFAYVAAPVVQGPSSLMPFNTHHHPQFIIQHHPRQQIANSAANAIRFTAAPAPVSVTPKFLPLSGPMNGFGIRKISPTVVNTNRTAFTFRTQQNREAAKSKLKASTLSEHLIHFPSPGLPMPIYTHCLYNELILPGVSCTKVFHYNMKLKPYYRPSPKYWCTRHQHIHTKVEAFSNQDDAEVFGFLAERIARAAFFPASNNNSCFRSIWHAQTCYEPKRKELGRTDDSNSKKLLMIATGGQFQNFIPPKPVPMSYHMHFNYNN